MVRFSRPAVTPGGETGLAGPSAGDPRPPLLAAAEVMCRKPKRRGVLGLESTDVALQGFHWTCVCLPARRASFMCRYELLHLTARRRRRRRCVIEIASPQRGPIGHVGRLVYDTTAIGAARDLPAFAGLSPLQTMAVWLRGTGPIEDCECNPSRCLCRKPFFGLVHSCCPGGSFDIHQLSPLPHFDNVIMREISWGGKVADPFMDAVGRMSGAVGEDNLRIWAHPFVLLHEVARCPRWSTIPQSCP